MKTSILPHVGHMLMAVAAMGWLGCSSGPSNPPTFPVSGTITRAGTPLENASIILIPVDANGTPAMANSDAQGKFELTTFVAKDGARPGEYQVKVSQYDKPVVIPEDQIANMTYEEEQAAYKGEGPPVPMPKNLLPKKYENPNTSGIKHSVPEAPSILTIEIK